MVVGGAGYVGSHMCKMLAESGHEVVVFDNLSTGHYAAVKWGELFHSPLSDVAAIDGLFRKRNFDAVMHFAANSIVADSVSDPLKYYQNNVAETISLLESMRRNDVRKFVFSSTAAIFGEPLQKLIDESHPHQPINPYGRSKLMVEQILADSVCAGHFDVVSLRYFNAAGADGSGLIGESHNPETHLIPKILRKAAGEQIDVKVFGVDYPTEDGTCIRDYIHVNDLCSAHLKALEFLGYERGFHTFNLGNGRGYSVKQIITAVEEVVGFKIPLPVCERRLGDPAVLVASSARALQLLGWTPQRPDVREIIESAWKWHQDPAY